MQNALIFSGSSLGDVLRGFIEHTEVTLFIAIILLLIGFFRRGLVDLSSWFVAVRVHGEWATTLMRLKAETSVKPTETQKAPPISESPSWFLAIGLGEKWERVLASLKDDPKRMTDRSDIARVVLEIHDEQSVGTKQQNGAPHEHVTLHQFFNKVWGESVVQSGPKLTYKVRGQIIGEKLSLVFREKGGFDSGAILLQIKSRVLMEGYEVGTDEEGRVYSYPYKWQRRGNL